MTDVRAAMYGKPIQILLVEDSESDIGLTREALLDARVANELHVVRDGEAALAFLTGEGEGVAAPRPDLILLDLNLPRIDGREVLQRIKRHPDLRRIPVAILTTSSSEGDVAAAYDEHANCYITKPVEFEDFLSVVRSIEGFWLSVVSLPQE